MFYIYKKTHKKTGLKYLGYTKNNPQNYPGSGIKWTRHLKKYGEDVITEILETCETKEDVKIRGRYYSDLWNVAESSEWANLKKEEGDGGDMSFSKKWLKSRTDEKLRKTWADKAKGNTNVRGTKWWQNITTGEKKRCVECPGEGWVNKCIPNLSEEGRKKISQVASRPKTKEHIENLRIAAKNRPSNAKGTIWVVNDDGKKKRVKPNEIPEGFRNVKEI
jgi:hypothetical protein